MGDHTEAVLGQPPTDFSHSFGPSAFYLNQRGIEEGCVPLEYWSVWFKLCLQLLGTNFWLLVRWSRMETAGFWGVWWSKQLHQPIFDTPTPSSSWMEGVSDLDPLRRLGPQRIQIWGRTSDWVLFFSCNQSCRPLIRFLHFWRRP